MSGRGPDVLVIRGAPGSGKSATAKCLVERLARCVRVEVDTLRAMLVPADWANQDEHISVLSLAARLVVGFLGLDHRPVIVVDTFSGDKLARFLGELREAGGDLRVHAWALVPSGAVLSSRVAQRPADRFKDVTVCLKLNADLPRFLVPGEQVIDNTELTPDEVAVRILQGLQGEW